MESKSRVASISLVLGLIGVALFVGGPVLIQVGALAPELGFRLFLLGALLGVLALLFGAVGLVLTRGKAGSGRNNALSGAVLGLVLVGIVVVSTALQGGFEVPPINDITTNTEDPPVFVAALEKAREEGRSMDYPGQSFAVLQQAAYGDLETIRLAVPPAQAFERIDEAMQGLGWDVTHRAPTQSLEAVHVSGVFKFADDIVVRIRPDGAGSAIDVRSKSRVGRGDIGANAARIRALRDAIN